MIEIPLSNSVEVQDGNTPIAGLCWWDIHGAFHHEQPPYALQGNFYQGFKILQLGSPFLEQSGKSNPLGICLQLAIWSDLVFTRLLYPGDSCNVDMVLPL